jgi:hypothetical protein
VVASVALCVHVPGRCATTFALAAASTPLDAPLPVHGDSEAQGEAPAGDHAPDSESAQPEAGTPRTFTVYVQLPSSPAGVASPISFTQGSSVPATVAQFVQAHAAELLAKGQQLSLENRMVSPSRLDCVPRPAFPPCQLEL